MAKHEFIARTAFGDFRRISGRSYQFCVARKDGWHQFSQTLTAAERELRYQERRGRDVVLVPVEKVTTRRRT